MKDSMRPGEGERVNIELVERGNGDNRNRTIYVENQDHQRLTTSPNWIFPKTIQLKFTSMWIWLVRGMLKWCYGNVSRQLNSDVLGKGQN